MMPPDGEDMQGEGGMQGGGGGRGPGGGRRPGGGMRGGRGSESNASPIDISLKVVLGK